MVHLQDAGAAYAAMVAAIGLVLAAPLAMTAITRFLHLLQIHGRGLVLVATTISSILPQWVVVRNLTWLLHDCPHIADPQQDCEEVKEDVLSNASRSPFFIEAICWRPILEHGEDVKCQKYQVESANGKTYK